MALVIYVHHGKVISVENITYAGDDRPFREDVDYTVVDIDETEKEMSKL